jgi:hypothetical protein
MYAYATSAVKGMMSDMSGRAANVPIVARCATSSMIMIYAKGNAGVAVGSNLSSMIGITVLAVRAARNAYLQNMIGIIAFVECVAKKMDIAAIGNRYPANVKKNVAYVERRARIIYGKECPINAGWYAKNAGWLKNGRINGKLFPEPRVKKDVKRADWNKLSSGDPISGKKQKRANVN